jgi:peptidyl-tRNA hydrolase, PTH1 family
MYTIVGLGNPGDQYEGTRHNVGRNIVLAFRKLHKFPEWTFNKKANALVSEGKIGKQLVTLVLPETFMNNSGKALPTFVKNKKQASQLLVLHDDLDIGVGRCKLSFNKSSGGHRGIDSSIKHLKTQEFCRLRLGIAPVTPTGKLKKVSGEDAVNKHVLSAFKPREVDAIKKIIKHGVKAIELFVEQGYAKAGNEVNGVSF